MNSEHYNRRLKSQRLARAIVATNQGVTADDVLKFAVGSDVWIQLAALATELERAAGTIGEKERVHPPNSTATVEAVCAELRRLTVDSIADLISGPPSSGRRERTEWA